MSTKHDTREHIMSEIEIQGRIIHENIIRLYSYSESDNYFYLVNYISKKDLRACK